MLTRNLGGGATVFEPEGEADHIGSFSLDDLRKRNWPPEVIANYRRYLERSRHDGSEPRPSDDPKT